MALIPSADSRKFVTEDAELYCEFLCGYSGIFTDKKVFPSRTWMHYLYGELKMETTSQLERRGHPHYIDLE